MSLNLWAIEYVLEVSKTGSISKAAQNLFLSQPHLSNTIKNVENELGVALFRRSAKGMTLTEAGEHFIREAGEIWDRVGHLESMFHNKPDESVQLNISVTRSYQINRCISEFINGYSDKKHALFRIKETNPFQVLEDVHNRAAELGVLHCFDAQQEYFINCFKAYSLRYQKHYERDFLIAVSEDSPLAHASQVTSQMLESLMVIMYGDYETPLASYQTVTRVSDIFFSSKRIYVYDRATAMETLGRCPNSYMWITGLHPDTLSRERLVLRRCADIKERNIGYSISNLDRPLSQVAQNLLDQMTLVDWTEHILE